MRRKKEKLIVVVLTVLIVVSIGFNFKNYNQKESYKKELQYYKKAVTDLTEEKQMGMTFLAGCYNSFVTLLLQTELISEDYEKQADKLETEFMKEPTYSKVIEMIIFFKNKVIDGVSLPEEYNYML